MIGCGMGMLQLDVVEYNNVWKYLDDEDMSI